MQRALNLPKLEGINVVQLLEQALERPVRVEIDVNAAAWAQCHALRPRPARFIYLSIGTGVGGGVILAGQLVRHTHGGPGHFGHLIVDTAADAPQCRCGARGCLEALVSGPALARGRRQNPERKRRAHAHGPAAQHDIGTAGRALGMGLLQLAVIYAPDVIAVGGGVIDHEPGLLERARELLPQLAGTLVPAGLQIEQARLSADRAGIIGAALLALAQ
jgi:predicted NBD/HSP70 family sugar kinase